MVSGGAFWISSYLQKSCSSRCDVKKSLKLTWYCEQWPWVSRNVKNGRSLSYARSVLSVTQLMTCQGKAIPVQDWTAPRGLSSLMHPERLENRHMKVARLLVLRTGLIYPQEIFLVLISFRGWVEPKATVRPEGLTHLKISVTLSGIEPATFWLVEYCFSQQHHHVPRW